MKIGIDIGGSHIAVGLVENGKIIIKKEKDFEENKKSPQIIEEKIEKYIKEILEEKIIKLEDIEQIRNISTTEV